MVCWCFGTIGCYNCWKWKGIFLVSCRFKNYEDDFCWNFIGVYGPTLKKEREVFWGELGAIRGLWGGPWCVAGNINVVRFPMECSKGGRLTSSKRRFFEIIEDLELRDLPLQGGPYTWRGG